MAIEMILFQMEHLDLIVRTGVLRKEWTLHVKSPIESKITKGQRNN